jgi:hypothetical protein
VASTNYTRYPIDPDGHVDCSKPATAAQIKSGWTVGVSPEFETVERDTPQGMRTPAPPRTINAPILALRSQKETPAMDDSKLKAYRAVGPTHEENATRKVEAIIKRRAMERPERIEDVGALTDTQARDAALSLLDRGEFGDPAGLGQLRQRDELRRR